MKNVNKRKKQKQWEKNIFENRDYDMGKKNGKVSKTLHKTSQK